MPVTIDKLREFKGEEQLAHLYVDKDDTIRDRHIEDMWTHLYSGKPLDAIFRTNFCMYHGHLNRAPKMLPAGVFDNVSEARAWVTKHYGPLTIMPFNPDEYEYDPELASMRFMVKLRCRTLPVSDEYCYAPSELGAILLSVVNAFRHMANDYIEQLAS